MTSIQLYAADDEIIGLGDFTGGSFFSAPLDVSADGSVVVGASDGTSGYEAFRWTQSGGMVSLGYLAGGGSVSIAYGVNADGSVVVGTSDGASGIEAFRWTQSGGMAGIGYLTGGNFSQAMGVNADGSVVVGRGNNASSNEEAFRWTQSGGMVGLGYLAGGNIYSVANRVNADGSVVVGLSKNASNNNEAFRWTQSGGMVGLGDLAGGIFDSDALDVNADGSVVVGYSESANGTEAFRWTQSGGMVGLGDLAGGVFSSQAYGVNADGSVVVGISNSDVIDDGFRWTESGGMQSIAQWLTDNDVTVAITPGGASAVSDDGSVVVGMMATGEAYLARVSDIGSGLTTIDEISDSLTSTTEGVGTMLRTASTQVNGAHSRPMSRRVAVGQKTVWLAGDWGHDKHKSRDGSIGLAEVGAGHNFGSSQINVSLGKTWADQDLIHNGDIDADGKYVMVEGILPVAEEKGLYATIGAYYHWGNTDIRRGYLNAGLADTSSASPGTRTWWLRARIDWENAFSAASTQFSPYADLSYTDIRMDGYTETGGGFPARFDRRNDEVTELRAGLNVAMPISSSSSAVQVAGNIEAAHRFDDEGARTSGQLLGLFAFDLAGQNYDSTWLKGGVGVEGQLGQGKASLMLNGTTEGEMPSAWLAASYQMTF